MLKKIKANKLFISFLVLFLVLGISFSTYRPLKAQPGPGYGSGAGGVYIENQLASPQLADFWIRNDAKLGPTGNDYIYFDPTVTQASQNNIYINSTSTAGNFIKLQVNNADKFRVEKNGDVYMSDVYMDDLHVNNIVSNEMTNQLNSYLYRTFDNGYHPYFAVAYHFASFPSGDKPSGSGNYIFIGANSDYPGYLGRIYIVKQDTGEIVDTASSNINKVAGLAVVQAPVGDGYALFAALDANGDDNRDIVRYPITFDGPNNEPNLTTTGEPISYLNNQISNPFYIRALANWLYVTDNVDDKIHKFLSGDAATIANTLITQTLPYGLHPYAMEIQTSPNPAVWLTVYSSDGGTGKLLKRNYIDLTAVATVDISYDCPQPKLMVLDKYNNVWVTCSNTQYYYSNTPYYLGGNSPKIVRVNSQNYDQDDFYVPYFNGSSYQNYNINSLPFGIYYHPNFEQILVGNRADGRIYRFNLSGQLINCDGTIPMDPSGLTDFQACVIESDLDPIGVLLSSFYSFGNNTDSFWALSMSGTNAGLYRNQSMETLYTGDIYTNGHVVSFGEFINDGGVTSAGHEKLVIDVSGYQDKVSFFVDQSNTNNDRGNILFFGNNASTQTGVYEYDFNNFTLNAEKVMIGPYWDGQAAANAVGTKNKGEIYLQGMVVIGSDSLLSSAVVLNSGENLLYGVIDNSSTGKFIELQTRSGVSNTTKFSIDKNGNTTVGGSLNITGSLKTPGGLEVLGSYSNSSCTAVPTSYTYGTIYICKWCINSIQHQTLRVRLFNSWEILKDATNSGNCNET